MSVRTIYECDRCGAEIPNDLGASIERADGRATPFADIAGARRILLCANCRIDFDDFLKREDGKRV